MKKIIIALALLLPSMAFGQTFTTAGRASVGVDYKIAKGFHIEAEEEMRTADSFSALGSMRTTLGVSYKALSFLKVGAGYTLINPYKTGKELDDGTTYNGFWAPRHRLYGDITGTLKVGQFNFSLKERLQFTHNADAGMNVYQNTRNAFALKSKLTVKYKGWNYVEPSFSFEARLALNDPWGSTSGSEQTNKSGKSYYAYTHSGYTHVYFNRYRFNLQADINFSKQHSLTPYLLMDLCSDYEIDTNSDGTRLFTATTGWESTNRLTLGLSYKFSF